MKTSKTYTLKYNKHIGSYETKNKDYLLEIHQIIEKKLIQNQVRRIFECVIRENYNERK